MTDWDDGDPGDIDTLADAAYEAADIERKRLRENRPEREVREWCREWLPDGTRCSERAETILWGKMLPPEALGPRCYYHAAEHLGGRSVHDPQWATFDLRGLMRAQPSERAADAKHNHERGDE